MNCTSARNPLSGRPRADFASSSAGRHVLQCKPDEPTQAERKRDQELEALARDPGEAHQAWRKLSTTEQNDVVERMRRRYGGPFAQQFLDVVKEAKPKIEVLYYQPGSGPTPDTLIARGYRRAGPEFTGNAAFDVEVWVHPSGSTIRRDVSTYKFGAADPEKKPETEKKKPETKKKKPPIVDPPIDDKPYEAMELLAELQSRNSELLDLCASDPYQSENAEEAQINWTFSRDKLEEFKNVDMKDVYPDFWKEVDAATADNLKLRAKCCKRDPSNYFFFCDELQTK